MTQQQPHQTMLSDGGEPRINQILKLFADDRRRYIIRFLQEHETVSIEEMASRIADLEADQAEGSQLCERNRQIFVDLYHNQLPRLEANAIVEFDNDEMTIRYIDLPQFAEELLDQISDHEMRHSFVT